MSATPYYPRLLTKKPSYEEMSYLRWYYPKFFNEEERLAMLIHFNIPPEKFDELRQASPESLVFHIVTQAGSWGDENHLRGPLGIHYVLYVEERGVLYVYLRRSVEDQPFFHGYDDAEGPSTMKQP